MTPDRIFYPLAALVAAGLIALALVYPQGEGERSPDPFGHTPTQQKAAELAALRANARADIEARKAADTAKTQASHQDADPLAARADRLK
jgi:hypothetical protein